MRALSGKMLEDAVTKKHDGCHGGNDKVHANGDKVCMDGDKEARANGVEKVCAGGDEKVATAPSRAAATKQEAYPVLM